MVVGVLSDSHISDKVDSLHPALIPALRASQVNLILHAGDVCVPKVLDELGKIAPVKAVRGNRDWFLTGNLPWVQTFDLEGVQVALMHGHGGWINYIRDKITYIQNGYQFERYQKQVLQMVPEAKLIIFGHTHFPENVLLDGRLVFNPGSCAMAIEEDCNPTFGLLRIEAGKPVVGEIKELVGYRLDNRRWVKQ